MLKYYFVRNKPNFLVLLTTAVEEVATETTAAAAVGASQK